MGFRSPKGGFGAPHWRVASDLQNLSTPVRPNSAGLEAQFRYQQFETFDQQHGAPWSLSGDWQFGPGALGAACDTAGTDLSLQIATLIID